MKLSNKRHLEILWKSCWILPRNLQDPLKGPPKKPEYLIDHRSSNFKESAGKVLFNVWWNSECVFLPEISYITIHYRKGLPSLKLIIRTWKWIVGRRSFPFGAPPIFRGYVSFGEGTCAQQRLFTKSSWTFQWMDTFCKYPMTGFGRWTFLISIAGQRWSSGRIEIKFLPNKNPVLRLKSPFFCQYLRNLIQFFPLFYRYLQGFHTSQIFFWGVLPSTVLCISESIIVRISTVNFVLGNQKGECAFCKVWVTFHLITTPRSDEPFWKGNTGNFMFRTPLFFGGGEAHYDPRKLIWQWKNQPWMSRCMYLAYVLVIFQL